MAKRRITGKPGLFGYVYHYDEKGKCVGKSRPSLMGDGKVHFDAKGKQVGTSRPGFFAKEVYHDEENERYISSYEGLTGDVYFDNGTPVGVSHPGFGGTEYTTLDAEDESDEAYFAADEFLEEDDLQEYDGSNPKSTITNIIVFAACCLVVGILILIFK